MAVFINFFFDDELTWRLSSAGNLQLYCCLFLCFIKNQTSFFVQTINGNYWGGFGFLTGFPSGFAGGGIKPENNPRGNPIWGIKRGGIFFAF